MCVRGSILEILFKFTMTKNKNHKILCACVTLQTEGGFSFFSLFHKNLKYKRNFLLSLFFAIICSLKKNSLLNFK
jgi:hypothetical protein